MLSPAQIAAREGKITASFLPALMAGDDDAIYRKWLELIGDPSWTPEDFTDNWPVQWGSYGEPFILDWHQRMTGQELSRRGEVVTHPTKDYVACTLDGFRAFDSTVLDAKVCNAFNPLEEIIAYYTPQLIVQRACTGAANAALLLVHGSAKPVEYPIVIDAEYEAKLWQRVDQFQYHVENFIPPVTFPRVVPPEQWVTIDLDKDAGQFNWVQDMQERLQAWGRTKDYADEFDQAAKDIKKLLPDDCGTLTWSGLIIKRNRAGAVSIKRAAT